ncbi:exocyst complex subunit 8 [Heterostelium album PN500]|uniref:Exocyst complex subunit 8 n=1 Tax=Heterostelium pallidum (strain ATCC 26659 / Pp 5 / PN500) TaxID=670386 RepID=D3B195_HETP5|nr:exocyst complex subunit 8 [Heterostelium album PN500]EFA85069.1 exocyst complex subunit 8 [Heterostelium album PN500]|eukprot:XP_020437179.1 exocyst complex subunit 8 [Heterostelium album PN500]
MKKGGVYDLEFDSKLSTASSNVVYQNIECVDIRPSGIYVLKFMYREWIGPLTQLVNPKSSIKISIDLKEGLVTCLHTDKKKTVYRWDINQGLDIAKGGGASGSKEENNVSYTTFSNNLFSVDKYTNDLFQHKNEIQSTQHLSFLNERKLGCIDFLKKDVYKNHTIFIGASKEIANSEVDMLDFRNLITDYGNHITAIQNLSINWDHYKIKQQSKNEYETLSKTTEPIQWLTTVPHELEVAVEQREFETAVSIVEKINEIYQNNQKVEIVMQTHPLKELVDQRIKSLTETLIDTLRSPILKPTQIKETIAWLVRLGQTDQAKTIFLESRTNTIQAAIKKLVKRGDLVRNIGEITKITFSQIDTTCQDYCNSFSEAYMTSGLIEWIIYQLEIICDTINRQVFIIDNFQTISHILRIVESHCEMLDQSGLSLISYWNLLLNPHLEKLISTYESKIVDLLQQHLNEEKWVGNTQWEYEITIQPKSAPNSPVQSPKNSFISQHLQHQQHNEEVKLKLTESTIFLNTIIQRFANDICHITTVELIPVVSSSLQKIFKEYMSHLLTAMQKDLNDSQAHAIISDAVFITEDLLFRISNRIEDALDRPINNLEMLKENLDGLFRRIRDEYAAKKAVEIVVNIMIWDEGVYSIEEEIEPFPKKFIKLSEYLETLSNSIQNNVNVESVIPITSRILSEIVVVISQKLQTLGQSMSYGYGGLQHFVLEMKYLNTILGKYEVEQITYDIISSMIENAKTSYATANSFDPETVLKPKEEFDEVIVNLVYQKAERN